MKTTILLLFTLPVSLWAQETYSVIDYHRMVFVEVNDTVICDTLKSYRFGSTEPDYDGELPSDTISGIFLYDSRDTLIQTLIYGHGWIENVVCDTFKIQRLYYLQEQYPVFQEYEDIDTLSSYIRIMEYRPPIRVYINPYGWVKK